MKRFFRFVPLVALVALAFGTPRFVYASCPWWQIPCPTNTPTPTLTPTPTILLKQIQQVNPNIYKLIGTQTPTPTVTSTPTPTATITPTGTIEPTLSGTPGATETPVLSPTATVTAQVTPTPQPTANPPLTKREMAFGGLVIVVLIILILQANWVKVKSWLHKKTE